METPIRVIVTKEGYSSYNTAFMTDRLDAIGYDSNRYEAVCDALTKAGLLEIIDIEELRKRNQKQAMAAPEPMAFEPKSGLVE